MNTATTLFQKAFNNPRDPRSEAYKAGVMDTLNFKESGQELKHPFEPGSAESDAWFAGNREGLDLWREHQGEVTTNHARINNHYTNLGLSSTKFLHCQTLFQAIIATTKSGEAESQVISLVEDIADIGDDISGHRCEQFDAQRDGLLQREYAEFKGGAK
jgi:hypothetical protein